MDQKVEQTEQLSKEKLEGEELDRDVQEVGDIIKQGLSQWPEFVDEVTKRTHNPDKSKALDFFWSSSDFVHFTRGKERYYVYNNPEIGELDFEIGGRPSTLAWTNNAKPADVRILLQSRESQEASRLGKKGIEFGKLKEVSRRSIPGFLRTGEGGIVSGPSVASVPESKYDRDTNTTSAVGKSKELLRKTFGKKPSVIDRVKTAVKAA